MITWQKNSGKQFNTYIGMTNLQSRQQAVAVLDDLLVFSVDTFASGSNGREIIAVDFVCYSGTGMLTVAFLAPGDSDQSPRDSWSVRLQWVQDEYYHIAEDHSESDDEFVAELRRLELDVIGQFISAIKKFSDKLLACCVENRIFFRGFGEEPSEVVIERNINLT
ncbi:hypothetical protein [Stratiformator vulcanicus]|uniref:Uncharacterized protein n=1 Tax=Stratiformator vulcanicus TaxID=2527980 RepID=A0A517R4M9_9PLAN|nr:hypothetical protein [Stratiformator vulcanicus]QDT38826.1 hypothetical protein Pan189_32250 [Stratiformator vulcanicus]